MKTIEKEVSILASAEQVWEVLPGEKSTRIWYAEFCEGAHATGEWTMGSKAAFTDKAGNGLIATIMEHVPAEIINMQYQGEVVAGKGEYNTPVAKELKCGKESHPLSEANGVTQLAGSGDMDYASFELISAAWERALGKIK